MRGSSEAVGSSRRITSGRSESTDAIAARFFSPPESSNGARSARWAISIWASASSQRALTSARSKPELERPEGDVVEDGGAEELDVGVLEDEADLAVEPEGVDAGGDGGDVRPERPHRAAGRRDDPVEQLEQRRLAAAVRAEQRHLLAGRDVEVDAVEGDLLSG